MTRHVLVVAVCVVTVLTSGAARANFVAGTFHYEPADYWPTQWLLPDGNEIYNPWVTPPPYQRNIRFTFDNRLAPWTPIYYGTDDGTLDPVIVYPGTAFAWFDNDAAFHVDGVARRFGLIGIDNRQGPDNVLSGIQVVIENWDSPSDFKHIWQEVILSMSPDVEVEPQPSFPDNFAALAQENVVYDELGDNFILTDGALKIYPNPPWEQLTYIVTVPPGEFFIVDEIHFATECVPEPTSVTLGILGAAALAAIRRRRRQ